MTELFIKYLKGHVGDIYVWGAQGETNITEKWIRRRETGEKNAERAIALWEKRKAEGRSPIAAFDCSGLIVKFLLDNKLIKSDMSSRGLYSACEKLNGRYCIRNFLKLRSPMKHMPVESFLSAVARPASAARRLRSPFCISPMGNMARLS